MTTTAIVPMLANSWVEFVVISLGVVIWVGSAIAGSIKKRHESQQSGGGKMTLEEIAAQRRAQIERLREQGGGNPDNMTVGQADERAKARTLYERRAEALRRQREEQGSAGGRTEAEPSRPERAPVSVPTAPPAPPAPWGRRNQGDEDAGRAAAELRARAEAERLRQEKMQRAAVERERREAIAKAKRDSQEEARRQQQAKAADVERQQMLAQARRRDSAKVVAAPEPIGSESLDAGSIRGSLRGRGLRRAVIMKEILDRPLSLRKELASDAF